jgi:UDP-MurNAc hydroxylase
MPLGSSSGAFELKIQLLSHSCVLVETADCKILADPWFVSRVFNNSWTLFPEPHYDESMLKDVDYLWISHEHPDHFNIPTLRMLPEEFRSRVTVLFQQNNSQKMFDAFARFGYPLHRALGHREIVRLTEATEVYCYQVGQMDSCLGVRDSSGVVLNYNDAYANKLDSTRMRRDIGEPDVLLKQFSIAGYGGFEDLDAYLPAMATKHIDSMLETHDDVGAKVTIPFASFVVYSSEDNRYMNDYSNSTQDVVDRFEKADMGIAVLGMGDVYDTESIEDWDSSPALGRYREASQSLAHFEYSVPEATSLEEIKVKFDLTRGDLTERYPAFVLRLLKPVTVGIPDLKKVIRFSIADGSFEEVAESEPPDLVVNSQPLCFALGEPFGVQTLGISGRVRLCKGGDENNWARHRVLFALYNAEFYLRPKYLFTTSNLRYLWARRRGFASQLATRIGLMAEGR